MAELIVNPAEATTPIDVVCGNANAEVIRFVFDRNSDGVDLADCAWAVTVKNSGGFSDVYMEGHGITNVNVNDDSISVDWQLFGIAVGTTGRTIYQLMGLQGKAIVKQFPYHTINVLSYLQSTLSSEAEEDHSALRETIEYVGNQLPGILEAEAARKVAETERAEAEDVRNTAEDARNTAEEQRAAAEDDRSAAEEERIKAFDLLELKVQKEGKVTTVTAVNIDGTTTLAEVLDGKDGTAGEGTGDMLRETYDPDGDGVVKAAEYATTAGSANNIPTPSVSTSGKALVVGPDGKYALGEAGAKDAVLYTAQALSENQKTQARTNLGLSTVASSGSYNDLSDTPAIPTGFPADKITAGTFAGMVHANEAAQADLATAQLRNVAVLLTDPGDGVVVDYPVGTVIVTP